MKNDGWTWNDLAGELMERGVDPDTVSDSALNGVLAAPCPEIAADHIARGAMYRPDLYRWDVPVEEHGCADCERTDGTHHPDCGQQ